MRLLFLTFSLPLVLLGAEPSAFGAGNLDSPNPYGLTDSEKHIFENKQTLETIEKKTRTQQTKVQSIQERVDGIQTILEGLIEQLQETRGSLQQLQQTSELEREEQSRRNQKIEGLVSQNAASLEETRKVLERISKLVDTIQADYVSKGEFNSLVREVNDFKKLVSSELKTMASGGGSVGGGKSNPDIAKEAYDLYKQKHYTKAIELYEYLISKNYKPAHSHYMIGEMYYYRKDYDNAIAYFKESAKRYDKASYMPVLLLHTAVAMEATGDIENARQFYNAILAKYPNDQYADDARQRLERLQSGSR